MLLAIKGVRPQQLPARQDASVKKWCDSFGKSAAGTRANVVQLRPDFLSGSAASAMRGSFSPAPFCGQDRRGTNQNRL
jgi:hypothetical protein